ncbi:MAG TPA: hypothetical protein VFA10_18235 [Ktedonobacteraceae bacterium]|nr:hypothetical protein [Ktedonobacteraceae bacterium]
MCGYRKGISSAQLDLFSIKDERERALKRNKDFFVVESMGVACCSWVNIELPGAEFGCATTWGGEPKKVKAIKVKVWCLEGGYTALLGAERMQQLRSILQELLDDHDPS